MPTLAYMFRKLTLAVALLAGAVPAWGQSENPTVVAAPDWAVAETLMALGLDTVAMGNVKAYRAWMGGGPLPAQAISFGVNPMPNLELLAELDPALILIPPYRTRGASRLSKIAPVQTLTPFPYSDSPDFWEKLRRFTREVGRLTDRQRAATQLIADIERHLARERRALDGDHDPLVIVQLLDQRHIRVFGDNSLLQAVLNRLGLTNAWNGQTNRWGFSIVGLDALADVDARLVVLETAFPVGIEHELATSGLWQHLPSVQRGDLITLPPTFWIFGGMPSAKHFADALVDALEKPDAG
ncbi:iron-siderophore ABC transporter substrate-binding protein [Arhodomonas sp. AD133]|uniref:iron-siderophore ABC transporter substrate-binding protein n=1 Tax=Arhodomonas sp. AD133 TaxID=3415009 RepID=UPI003EBA1B68